MVVRKNRCPEVVGEKQLKLEEQGHKGGVPGGCSCDVDVLSPQQCWVCGYLGHSLILSFKFLFKNYNFPPKSSY